MDRKINFIDVLKDKASILRATLSLNRHVSSIHVSVLRATSHHPSTPPSPEKITDILELGNSSRNAACACIGILMDRLHATRNAFVALKCLLTIHSIVSGASSDFRDMISYHPSFGGRNFLNMVAFSDKSGIDTWEFSSWVRWYAAVVEQSLKAAKVIGYYYLNPDRIQRKLILSKLTNNEIVNEIEALVEFVARVSDVPESISLQSNDVVYEIVKAAGEDYRAVQGEIMVRVMEIKAERMGASEMGRVVEELRRLEECRERLVRLFANRRRNEGLWEAVRKTRKVMEERKAEREETRMVVRVVSSRHYEMTKSTSSQCSWNPFLEPGQLLFLPSSDGSGRGGGWLEVGPSPIAV